jgi:hypothetical protein
VTSIARIMRVLNMTLLGAILAGLVSARPVSAVGVTLTYGSPTSVDTLVLKPGETCEARHLVSFVKGDPYPSPADILYLDVQKDGLDFRFQFLMYSDTGADLSKNRFVVTGPATIKVSCRPHPTLQSAGGLASFEVTPAPVSAEKLVVAPEGQSTRLVLETSTNLTQWAPVFSTVLTNVPANQFVRVRAEKVP